MRELLIILYNVLNLFEIYLFIFIITTWIPALRNYKWYQLFAAPGNAILSRFRGLLIIGYLDFGPMLFLIVYHIALDLLVYVINCI